MSIGYFALSLNTSNLHGSSYLNCFVSAAIEVPAYLVAWVLFRFCGRRPSLCWTLFLGGVMMFFTHLLPSGETLPLSHSSYLQFSDSTPDLIPTLACLCNLFIRPELDFHGSGNAGEVWRDSGFCHRVRLHSGALPHCPEKHSRGGVLHGIPRGQHLSALHHIPGLVLKCSVLSVFTTTIPKRIGTV